MKVELLFYNIKDVRNPFLLLLILFYERLVVLVQIYEVFRVQYYCA